jgi:Holliday junction resolvasome RuvABC endonuclease subunit
MGVILRIMGLDPSLSATGICLPDNRVLTIKCKSDWGDDRLVLIRNVVRRFITETSPDIVIMEDKLHSSFSAAPLGMVQGVIRAEFIDHRVPYVLISPKTLKKFATGNGNADKAAMIAAARKRARVIFKDDNQCDAFFLRQAGLDHYELPTDLGPDRDPYRALGVVRWPVRV